MTRSPTRSDRLRGLLLGTAVGDALGLPMEGLAPRRAARLFPPPLRPRLLPGSALVSDDTEHTLFVAQALLAAPEDERAFVRRLAWSLRLWLLLLPAGIGWATLRAIFRLWCGIPPQRSGVHSAGNGPAMRVAPIGAIQAEHPERLTAFVTAATRITHRDPRALTGALAIARVAAQISSEAWATRPPVAELAALLRGCGSDPEWSGLVERLEQGLAAGWEVERFAEAIGAGGGVSGYIYRTVPVCLYAWHRHFGDFRATVASVIACGGDSDTSAAIAGALAGLTTGEQGIPAELLAGVRDWPRGVGLLRRVGEALAEAAGRPAATISYSWWGLPARNLFFLMVVLAHGFRRLLPPY